MPSLDPSVMDVVEEHPESWVVRVEGYYHERGIAVGHATSRWYFHAGRFGWYYLTEKPESRNRRTGTTRWALTPHESQQPFEAGELVHISHAPIGVQLWSAGFRPDPGEVGELDEGCGQQQDLSGWV